ncbi:MAG TPA: DUF4129 domain-containing protein [Pedococcus sp.]|jgi:hypothetical protein|uniref:DUF4129 domain-containing protein n=1 Tax=Pedococcus sp. TaxID=2860345 RepID=UPI002F925ED3
MPLSVAAVPDAAARLDPGNDQARRWLEEELSSAAYREHTDPLQRLLDAVDRALDNLLSVDPSTAGALPSAAAGVVTALVVGLLLYSLRHVRRESRVGQAPETVLGGERLTAGAFRERAMAALREGRCAAAVIDAMRAIAQRAAERTLLDDAPSLTAHEVAQRLAQPFPAQADGLRWAADLFDEVAYGRRDASPVEAETILALDSEVAASRPAPRRTKADAQTLPTPGGSR